MRTQVFSGTTLYKKERGIYQLDVNVEKIFAFIMRARLIVYILKSSMEFYYAPKTAKESKIHPEKAKHQLEIVERGM